MTDIFGNKQRYDRPLNGIIAAPAHIHDQLLKLVQETLAEGKNDKP